MSGKEPAVGPEEVVVRKRGRPKKIRNADEGDIQGKRQKIDINLSAVADAGADGLGTYGYGVLETKQLLNETPLGFPAAAFHNESRISQVVSNNATSSGIATGNVVPHGLEGESNATMGANHLSDELMRVGAWNLILRVHGSSTPAPGGAADFPGETGEMGERGLTLCICCRQPEIKRQTIICDSCEQSFHIGCVRLPYTNANDLDDWNCASCAPSTIANGDVGIVDQQYQDRKQGRLGVQKSAHRGRPRKIVVPRPQRTLDLNKPADASEEFQQMQGQNGFTEENTRFEDSIQVSNSGTQLQQMQFENKGADVSSVPVKEIVARDANADNTLNAKQLVTGFTGMELMNANSELSGSKRFIDAVDTTRGYQSNGRDTAAFGTDEKRFATAGDVGNPIDLTLAESPEKLVFPSKDLSRLAGKSSGFMDATGSVEGIGRVNLSASFNPPGEPPLVHDSNQINLPRVLVDDTKQTNLPSAFFARKENNSLTLEPNSSVIDSGCMTKEVTNVFGEHTTDEVGEVMGNDGRKSYHPLTPFRMGMGEESSGPVKVSNFKSDSGHEVQEVGISHSASSLGRLPEQALAFEGGIVNSKFSSTIQGLGPGHGSRVDTSGVSAIQRTGGEYQVLNNEEVGGTAYGKQDGEDLRANAEGSLQQPEDQQLKVVADETLRLLKDFISERHRVSLPDGWMVDVKRRRNDRHLDKYFISPDKQRFRSRPEVLRHLGLADELRGKLESQGPYRDSASPTQHLASEVEKVQVPFKCGDLTIETLGVVDMEASLTNNGSQLCPVGYRSSWHDAVTASHYISEVINGGNQTLAFRVTREFCPTSRLSCSETAGSFGSGAAEGANAVGKRIEGQIGGLQKQEANAPIFEDSVRALLGDLAGPADEEDIQDSGPTFRDEVGEITVEASSTVQAWRMLGYEFVNRCRKSPWVLDSLPHICPHVKLNVVSSYQQAMDTSGVNVDRSMESRLSALLERLEIDHFGLQEGFVQEMIRLHLNWIRSVEVENSTGSRSFQDRGLTSRPDGLVLKPNSQLRFRAREKARRQKRAPEGLSEEPKEPVAVEPSDHSGKDETVTQPPPIERPSPPAGRPLAKRIPADLVGDVLQIWEFLTRFAPIIRDPHPPLLEDLEEGLSCGASITSEILGGSVVLQPNLKEDRGNNSSAEPNMSAASTGMDLVVVGSESSRDGLSAQPNKPSTPSQMSLPQLSEGSFQNPKEGVAEVHQQDHHKQLTGESRLSASPVIVPKLEDSYADAVGCSPAKFIMSPGFALAGSIHIPLMKYLLSDLLSKLCGRDEVPGEAEESKPSKRGRKRVRDTVLRPILGREKLNDSFSMNEWTWPEIARRYIISISSLSKVGEISEVTTSECLKVLRCIQGDGGVLCGALDGVASMEVDAQLLAEAEKELAVGTHEHDDTDSPATPSANGKELEESKSLEPAGDTARWIKILDPISKLPTNVGSRIRNRVRDALEADPPEWASHLLEHSISKEVYKGNASGPTKRIVMEVISKYRGEDPKIRKTKKLRKRVIPSPEVVMQRCRIVLRQVAAEDKEHIVSKGIGEMITNFYESEGEGVLPRPLDFRAIDLRLGAGAYGTSPDAFAEDVRQIWKNISLIYGNDSDELKATNAFSELFESLFSKQVITFQRGVDSLTASAANGHTAGSAGEGAGHNTSGDGPSAPNVQENVKAPWEDDSCRICGIDDDHDNVLLCDGCDAEYHIYCLKPPLQEVPEGNWYCSSCEAVDKGFLEEPSVTEVAPESQTFEKQDDSVQQKITSTEDVLEKEHTQDAECPEDATSMALATKLEVTDYWRLSLADRVQFLKFLCDRALETLEIRIHMEEIMDVAGEMQQKLRQMLLERRRYTELGEGRVDNSRDAKNAFSVLQGSAAKARKQGVELGKEPVGNSSPHPNDLIDIPSSEDCLALSLPARDILTDVATLQASASEDTNMHSTSQEKHREQDLSNSDTIVVLNEEAINSDAAGLQDITENVGKPSQILGSGDTLTVTPAATHVIVGNSAAVNNDLKVSLSSTETGGHLLVRSTSSVDGDVTKIIHPRALQNSRDADIENAIAKLRSISIRRDSLGKDSCGREYWALFGCNAKPWVAVETLSSDRQSKTEDASATAASSSPTACHSTLNPENDADGGNDSVAGPVIGEHLQRKPENEHVWYIYSDGEALDKLIQWLSPTALLERSLRTNLLQWRSWFWTGEISDTGRGEAPETLQAKQEGFVTPDRANNISLASRGAGAWKTGSVSVTATLKATKILEWRYKGVCHSGSKETNSAVGSKRGRKKRSQAGAELSRCKCLEPVWSSRHHCATCHTTFESALDLEIHAKDTSCSPVKKNATEREPSKKSKKGGQTGKTSQSKKLSEVPVSAQSSALNGKLPEIAAMSFVVHETTRDRVNRIGLIADKGPSFAPGLSVAPAFDPSLMIFDSPVGHALSSTEGDANGNQLLLSTLAVGGTSCISHVDSEDSKSSSWVLVKSFEDLPGKADGASESSGILLSPEDRARLGTDKLDPHSTDHRRPENFSRGISQPTGANARGRLFQVTGKQLVISEASLISLADRDLRLLDQLKMNLFDIEAALESDMLQLGRAQTSRRQAWRSFVKKAKSIYTMVQAAIILEHMIRADFLRNSWGYWSSFSAAAKTATLSSLSLRVYALDAAILYENSRDYLGPESLACELKQTKKEKERKGTQASKSSGKKKRKDDASTS